MTTDTERLVFLATHALVVCRDDFGDWHVYEFTPTLFDGGFVNRNASFSDMRQAIDAAMLRVKTQLDEDDEGAP
ncbi:MAG TPA: hypothetical protein VM915_09750 [Verrucomicrobiae bacterium]|jgi:hypothetical protein|nr:hypothetical protein [Verrucomicrobiae bacterium]